MGDGIILGLDGGGTKTLAALADGTGRVLRSIHAEGLDPTAGADWRGKLAGIIAELAPGPVSAAVLGMPFHGEIAELSAEQQQEAEGLISGAVRVVNDVAVAYEGAFPGADGVLVLAGTGSMAWASEAGANGQVRVGGWGDAFGDEGSAFAIGKAALQRTSWHLDGRAEAAVFAAAMLERLGVTGDGLIDWAYGPEATRRAIGGLAATVSALAENGDATAVAIMTEAADQLVLLARTAARKAGLPPETAWSHAGGVFRSSIMRERVATLLGSAPRAAPLPPVGGALLAAARMAGWSLDDGWIDRLGRHDLMLKANG